MNFDLNINNYTRDELIDMFDLPQNFDKNIIEIKEAKLRENIINNTDITKETQNKTINFLVKAKNIILNGENINNNNQNNNFQNFKENINKLINTSYELKTTDIEDPNDHMVQVRHNKPFLSSFPSEFFPGVINPLKKRTIKKNLSIDSRFRENYYTTASTNFNINLPINFNNVIQMSLSSIEIPTSYFVISKQYNNNFFTIIIDEESVVVSIPDGNYTYETICDVINNSIDLLGAPFNNINFAINYLNKSGSCQMMVGAKDNIEPFIFELNFQADKHGADDRSTPLPLKLGWILGFRNGIYINNENYVSEGLVDISGPKYLFLVVDDHNNNVNNSFYSAFNSSILNNNILARITISPTDKFSIFSENNLNIVTTPREYFGPINLQIFNIQLLDEYGRVLDLNNMDFSFCLTLTTIYDI
jgi:hypothetical protein